MQSIPKQNTLWSYKVLEAEVDLGVPEIQHPGQAQAHLEDHDVHLKNSGFYFVNYQEIPGT